MAVRGRKPTPTEIKKVKGNPGKRKLNENEPVSESSLEIPAGLSETERQVWDEFIASAWWLRKHDGAKARVFVVLFAEFLENPHDMPNSRITNMRVTATELGLDPSSRSRMDAGDPDEDDPNAHFFNW